MRPLDGKAALITGGSRGVGRATALRLAGLGAAVTIVARDTSHLTGACQAVEDAGGRVLGVTGDVADATVMRRAVEQTEGLFDGLDILVNNAAIGRYGPVDSFPTEDWRRVIETNLTGAFIATQAALPAIRRRGGGHIIAISSGAGKQGYPNMSAYCASKAGLEGFMAAVAAEVADEAIKCTTIVPGGILTDFGIRTREDRLQSGDKFLEPDDVADVVEYVLTRPERAWMQELVVWPR